MAGVDFLTCIQADDSPSPMMDLGDGAREGVLSFDEEGEWIIRKLLKNG